MPPFVLAAIGAGVASAVFHASLLTGSLGAAFFLFHIAQLPLLVVGLWMGVAAALVSTAVAVLALAALGGLLFALAYALANAAPAVAVTYLALLNRPAADGGVEWFPPGQIVAWLVGIAMAALLAVSILLIGEPGGAEGVIRGYVTSVLNQLIPPDVAPEGYDRMAMMLGYFFPGVLFDWRITVVILNAVLAQALLVRFGRNLRPSPAMADVELPSWLIGATTIAAIGSFLPGTAGFVGGNLVLIAVLAYALAGLAVVHAFAARSPNRTFVLVGIYTLLFVFGGTAVVLALLGAAEPWLNLRRRLRGGSGT
jgi:hypothetical protein